MPITTDNLDNWFSYHAPEPGPYKTVPVLDGPDEEITQAQAYGLLREAAKQFALVVVGLTPSSADQTTAVRKIREAVMTANAAIACGGR